MGGGWICCFYHAIASEILRNLDSRFVGFYVACLELGALSQEESYVRFIHIAVPWRSE